MRPLIEDQLINCLDSRSYKRLNEFRSALGTDRDSRNRDEPLDKVMRKYAKPEKSMDIKETWKYLNTLKSSKDGLLFSQGVKQYSMLNEAFARFQSVDHPTFRWNINYQKAKAELIGYFSKAKLRNLTYLSDEDIVEALPKLTTHAGFEFIRSGLKFKGDNLGNIFRRYSEAEARAKCDRSFNEPILPATRTQCSGAFEDNGERTGDCKHKTRLVSMISLMQIIAELRFAFPLQNWLAEYESYAGGKDPGVINHIIAKMRDEYQWYVSLDYSSYDQTLSSWLIKDVFEILHSSFIECDEDLWKVIVDDFIYKNFITADGIVYAAKGVPSGSMFTQIVGSVANVLMMKTYMIAKDVKGSSIMMGDDNLSYFSKIVRKDDIASYLAKNFGVIVNASKSSEGSRRDNPNFLSRCWTPEGQYREPHVVLSKMWYPERYRKYKGTNVTPEMVFYAYCLTYPLTMREYFDVYKFHVDNPNLNMNVILECVDHRYVPGALAFIAEYTRRRAVA